MDATIEIISEIVKHPKADRLEIAKVLGFKCVVQKNIFDPLEKVVYIRPDAVLPIAPWSTDYRKYAPVRVKTVNLRDEWSEGFIVPFEKFPIEIITKLQNMKVGDDVSALIDVKHYVEAEPENEEAIGSIPFDIPKSGEDRFEELREDKVPLNELVDISLKIDGMSTAFFYDIITKRFGILSRGEEIKSRWYAENFFHGLLIKLAFKFPYLKRFFKARNFYDEVCEKYNIKEILTNYCEKNQISLVLRGEIYGEKIQSRAHNPHSKIVERQFAVYGVYLFRERRYAFKGDRFYYTNVAKELGLPICPMIEEDVVLDLEKIQYYSSKISTLNDVPFEGVVVKAKNTSFKILNKAYDSTK